MNNALKLFDQLKNEQKKLYDKLQKGRILIYDITLENWQKLFHDAIQESLNNYPDVLSKYQEIIKLEQINTIKAIFSCFLGKEIDIKIVKPFEKIPIKEPFDLAIITGSNAHVSHGIKKSKTKVFNSDKITEFEAYKHFKKNIEIIIKNYPTLAICYGFQMLSHLDKMDIDNREFKSYEKTIHTPMGKGCLPYYHSDYVITPDKKIKDFNISKKVISVQGHPELHLFHPLIHNLYTNEKVDFSNHSLSPQILFYIQDKLL